MLRRTVVAALLTFGLTASPAAAGDLASTQRVLAREMAGSGPAAGAYVIDLGTGQPLFAVNQDVKRIPASVNKLFTTSTALTRFGSEHAFTTDVLAQTPPDPTGVVQGDLYLRGGGDPTFTTADARLLAGELVADGVTAVTGRVVGDESRWDARRGTPASGYRTSFWVGPLSALTLDRGFVGRHFQTNPPLTAAKAFDRQLRKAHITVARRPRTGVTTPDATQLAQWISPTVGQLVARTNTPSDNFLAESLLKALGAEFGPAGSTAAGAAVVRSTVVGLGARPRLLDGSGLSRRDRTSPRDVVSLIRSMDRTANAPLFEGSLPVAGRTGTLSSRMRKSAARGRCHAKTGTLSDVSALAGLCDTRGGHRVAFAFLMNRVNVYSAHIHQDRMTAALARYG
jgi:D-alanyl-D-alanine carboxypeptidase/D-alanyl-D-alanine-endopeptidase (penicillin-binding protein 4)